jgi:hypothetical protein
MTNYAYEPGERRLLAVWGTGAGAVARPVARLHADTPAEDGLHLAKALTELSAATWRGYTDPQLLEIDPVAALAALRAPNRPGNGLVERADEPHLEIAHEVGRRLDAIGGSGVTRAVVGEVADDLDALERALCGDLSGRAQQAVELTRLDASPLQIAAADRLLAAVPMGSPRLFTEVDPTAAAVAATHWLRAAIDITIARTGLPDADALLAVAVPFGLADSVAVDVVLEHTRAGDPPLAAVQCLVRAAMLAARGMVVHDIGDPDADPLDEPRFTVLDPLRPARSLLERLVGAIQACAFVYFRQVDPGAVEPDSDLGRLEAARQVFDAAVRAEAERCKERLLQGAVSTSAR